MPATLAALCLADVPSAYSSHAFQFVFLDEAIHFQRRLVASTSSADTITIEEDNASAEDVMESAACNLTIHKIGDRVVAAGQATHYAFRGCSLMHLNIFEYAASVDVIKMPTKWRPKQRIGRKRNATYAFDRRHPLSQTHQQRLRSKYRVPVITCKRARPKFPKMPSASASAESMRAWTCEAKKWAEYFGVLLIPWETETTKAETSFQRVVTLFSLWKQQSSPYWQRCRYDVADRLNSGLSSSPIDRQVLSQWRSRNATNLQANEALQQEFREKILAKGIAMETEQPEITLQQIDDIISSIQAEANSDNKGVREFLNQVDSDFKALEYAVINQDVGKFSGAMQQQVRSLLPQPYADKRYSDLQLHFPNFAAAMTCFHLRDKRSISIKRHQDAIKLAAASGTGNVRQRDNTNPFPEMATFNSVRESLDPLPPANAEQLHAISQIVHLTCDPHAENRAGIFVHGGPGCGKSFTAAHVQRQLLMRGKEVRFAAPTGVAGVNIGGATLHWLANLSLTNTTPESIADWGENKHRTVRERIGEKTELIIIDEISMVTAELFATFEYAVRRAFNGGKRNQPFAGKKIMLLGDFCQMERGSGLHKAALMFSAAKRCGSLPPGSKLSAKLAGGLLFTMFRKIELTAQMRAQDDESQTTFVNTYRNLRAGAPVFPMQEVRKFQLATPQLFFRDPSFLFATHGVVTNLERHVINLRIARLHAKLLGQPILAWRKPVQIGKDEFEKICAAPPRSTALSTLPGYEFLIGFYLRSAPVSINQNLDPKSGLANGTQGVMVDVMWKRMTEEVQRAIQEYSQAPAGAFVFAPMPDIIVVAINPMDNETVIAAQNSISPLCASLSQQLQIFPSNVFNVNIIPIPAAVDSTRVPGENRSIVHLAHLADVLFASTNDKLQGKTIRRLIVHFQDKQHPVFGRLDSGSVYVAATRTKRRQHIALWPPSAGYDGFGQLQCLKLSAAYIALRQSYSDSGDWVGISGDTDAAVRSVMNLFSPAPFRENAMRLSKAFLISLCQRVGLATISNETNKAEVVAVLEAFGNIRRPSLAVAVHTHHQAAPGTENSARCSTLPFCSYHQARAQSGAACMPISLTAGNQESAVLARQHLFHGTNARIMLQEMAAVLQQTQLRAHSQNNAEVRQVQHSHENLQT